MITKHGINWVFEKREVKCVECGEDEYLGHDIEIEELDSSRLYSALMTCYSCGCKFIEKREENNDRNTK